jgi:hypothetical protein
MSLKVKFSLTIVLMVAIKFNVLSQMSLRFIANRLVNILPEEKVYLAFNKPYYSMGETVFFKAFAVMADNHKPDSISSVLYVEIIDGKTNVLKERKIFSLSNGITYGTFDTDSLQNDVKIIAYTKWMLNYPPSFMYNAMIPIFSKESFKNNIDKENEENIKVQFFPEGGYSIVGLASRIAVKSTTDNGQNISIEGKVIDNNGIFIDSFRTSELGLGHFILQPLTAIPYKVITTRGNQKAKEFILPEPLTTGFTMFTDVLTEPDKVMVFVETNLSETLMPDSLFFIAHTRGLLNYATKLEIKRKNNKVFYIEIPKKKFQQEGIVHLSLFSGDGIPLCERLFFNENKTQRLIINAKLDKSIYAPKEKIELDIEIKDSYNKPISTELSISVIDAEKVDFDRNSENILTYLLFSSDLASHIPSPYSFIQDSSLHTRQSMDWLMMTHGWRRFVWQTLFDTVKTIPHYFPENGFTLKGNVVDKKKSNKYIADQNILLTLKNKNIGNDQVYWSQTDSMGNFSLDNLIFDDSTTCFVKLANYKKEYNAKVVVDAPPSVFPNFNKSFQDYTSDENFYLEKKSYLKIGDDVKVSKIISLDTLTVKGKAITKLQKRDSRGFYYGKPNESIKIETGSTALHENLVSYLNGRYGLRMYASPTGSVSIASLRGTNSLMGGLSNEMPIVMVDGIQISPQMLLTIPMSVVEKVDIIRSANAMFGSRGTNGVINILTKDSKGFYNINRENESVDNLPFVKLTGFAISREFYTPDYTDKPSENNNPDSRNALYWSNTIKTDENGKSKIIFYNSDDCKKSRITLQCVDKEGKIGYFIQE